MGTNHWYAIYERSIENPESVIEVLMDSQQVKTNLTLLIFVMHFH